MWLITRNIQIKALKLSIFCFLNKQPQILWTQTQWRGFLTPSLSKCWTYGEQMLICAGLLKQQMEPSESCHGMAKWNNSLPPLLFSFKLCTFFYMCVSPPTECFLYILVMDWNKFEGLLVSTVCKDCHFNDGLISSFPIGVFDNCSHSLSEKGWSIGIRTMEPLSTKDARFYFTLRTDRAAKSTTVYSHQQYQANTWTHIMATYDGLHMTLYVDGAKVCVASVQGVTCW